MNTVQNLFSSRSHRKKKQKITSKERKTKKKGSHQRKNSSLKSTLIKNLNIQSERKGKSNRDREKMNQVITPEKKSSIVRRLKSLDSKNIVIASREIDEEECGKILEKFRPNKCLPMVDDATNDLKTQITLDRIKKKKGINLTIAKLTKEQSDETIKNKIDSSEEKTKKKIIKSREKEEKAQIEITDITYYDSFPKAEDVDKWEEDKNSDFLRPSWVSNFEPFDDDLVGVEPAISIGSEHIEMLHSKKFVLKNRPSVRIIVDQWLPFVVLKDRDKLLYSPQLVFSNTLRSLINAASNSCRKTVTPSLKATKNDKTGKNSIESMKIREYPNEDNTQVELNDFDSPIQFIDDSQNKIFFYLRSKAIETAKQRVSVTKNNFDTNNCPTFF